MHNITSQSYYSSYAPTDYVRIKGLGFVRNFTQNGFLQRFTQYEFKGGKPRLLLRNMLKLTINMCCKNRIHMITFRAFINCVTFSLNQILKPNKNHFTVKKTYLFLTIIWVLSSRSYALRS